MVKTASRTPLAMGSRYRMTTQMSDERRVKVNLSIEPAPYPSVAQHHLDLDRPSAVRAYERKRGLR